MAAATLCLCWLLPAALAQQPGLQQPGLQQSVSQQPGNGIMGRWWTQDHDGVVDIEPCGSGLCGRVAGITRFGADGSTPVDNKGRSRCNLMIISDGSQEADGSWDSHITNPDDGRVYTITLRLDPSGRLRMRGYIGIPLLGRTVFWTRFSGHISAGCHIG